MKRLALGALFFGTAFGFVLSWARLYDPEVIHRMLRLRELDVYFLMGSTIATGFLLTRAMRRLRVRSPFDGQPVDWKALQPTRSHVIGSVLFGVGWSVVNSCPGPIAVQIGRGEVSGIAAAFGILSGIALRDAGAKRAAPALDPSAAAAPAAVPGD